MENQTITKDLEVKSRPRGLPLQADYQAQSAALMPIQKALVKNPELNWPMNFAHFGAGEDIQAEGNPRDYAVGTPKREMKVDQVNRCRGGKMIQPNQKTLSRMWTFPESVWMRNWRIATGQFANQEPPVTDGPKSLRCGYAQEI